jgi:tetratricopeptide (TPR) repeat protein
VVALFGVRAALRAPVWADDATLFEHTVRDAPRSARAWAGLGGVRMDQDRPEDAARCFETALSIDPDSYPAHDGLGHVALGQGAYPEAMAHFAEAARISPREPASLYNAGVVHLRGGNPRRAIQAFEEALKIDPAHGLSVEGLASAWQAHAVRQAEAGMLAEAAESLTAAIDRVHELGGDTSALEAMLAEVRAAP